MYLKKLRVLLDTSFLMLTSEVKTNIFSEIEKIIQRKPEFITIQSVINELKRIIKKGKNKEKKKAIMALKIIKSENIKIIDDTGIPGDNVDEKILNLAKILSSERIIIATNDRELKKSLKELSKLSKKDLDKKGQMGKQYLQENLTYKSLTLMLERKLLETINREG